MLILNIDIEWLRVMEVNVIYNGDCVNIMKEYIESGTIDLIYADPPFNLSGKGLNLKNNKTGGPFYEMNKYWDVWKYDDYVNFTHEWIKESYRVLKNNGSLYVSCTMHNIGEIITASKKIGFKINNILTWYKPNSMPNITKRTFTHSTEYVCWFVKGPNWKFNYNQLKILNEHTTKEGDKKQMKDFIDFIQLPVLQGKERLKNADGRAAHPTQKPEKLLEIIITASSDSGDIVLDPFLGSGTTAVVAKKLGRKWIGIEIDKDYINMAMKRIGGIL